MPKYLVRASYTPQAWAALVKNPVDRIAAVNEMAKPAGVKITDAYFAFGDDDWIMIAEGPDNKSIAAVAIAAAAGGGLSKISTTVLMEPSEAREAMRIASTVNYSPPGG